ncbi:MAG: hypothetical protein JJE25_06330, partial [Bacteroidia bacterium]|nr:hypothetical protein [Bacteroidia bacterium]
MIRKITFLLPVLVVFFSSKALAQCALLSNPDTCDYYNHLSGPATAQTPCQTTVPHWCVDFTTGPQTFTSPSVPRLGNCCGTASPDRCANFVFCIGPNTAAVRFEICAGPSPPGSLNFNIDCGPPQDIRTLGCISTPGQHTLSFCKPGNNPNGYCLTAIPKPTQLVDDSIRIGCYDTLTYSGVHVTGSSWNSIFPGVPGQYNSYLSAPFAHIPDSSSSVIITPTAGAPAFIDYRVCGQAVAKDCIGPVTFCDTIRVYIFSSLAISIADTAKYCAGQGGVNLCPVISGGVTPYTYLWSTGATTACLFASSPGLYTVTVNDHLSAPTKCGPSVKTVRVLLDSINIIQNQTNDSCFGQCNGTINIGVTGGTSPYTYSWSDIGAGSPNRTGLCFGTYTVTVTDNGAACIGTASITITQPAVLAVVIDSIKNVGCNGEATGAVFIHPTGGTNPVTYQWSSGQITEDITGIGAGTYTVTITDALGCTATASQVISEPFVLVPLITSVSINGNDVSCWLAADDSSCASVTGGTAPFTYFWTPGDSTGSCVTGMGGGIIICVTVTDANGCTGDACHMLSQPDSLYLTVDAISSYFGGYNISCNGFTDGSIDIGTTGGTPPYIYDWSDIAGTPPPDEGEDRFGIVAGVYTVTVTDLNNCSATISVTLTEPPVLYDSIVSPVSAGGYNIICRGECNGTITTNTTGGTIPYSYQWTPNVSSTNSALNLCAGSYTVTVTDANGCSFTDTLTLTEPDTVFALITVVDLHNGTPITCDGECDGSVYVTASGGSPPYTYSWTYTPPTVPAYSATGDTIYNLCAGLVTVVVSDLNGCSAPADTLINAPPPMLVSISAVTFVAGWNEPCFGDCVDSATATITGGTSPYTYLWSNAQASQTATGLCAITYTVTVTDVNNCSATAEIDLFEPPPLSLTLDSTIYACGYNVSCVGACDGAIDLTVSGGTAPFTYLWSNSDVNEDISSLCAGTYTVTVTDANNCTVSQSITLTSPTAVTIDSITSPTFAGGWNVSCNAGEDGCVNTGISGGCPPYVFAWSNGDTTQNICNLSVTIYILT